ncbi:ABC transporter ATP-binding protein [Trichothermofontia sp.]
MRHSRLRKLLEYLRPHRSRTVLGIGALLLVNAIGVYIPLLIRDAIDQLQTDLRMSRVGFYVGLILVLASVMWGIRMVSRVMIFGVGRQVEFDLKQRIFEHLLTLEPGYFQQNTIGDLINRTTSDVDNIRRLLGFAVLSLANIIFAYGMTLPLMLLIDLRLTLLAIAVYPVMLILVQIFSDRLRDEQQTVQEELSDLSTLIQEDVSGISVIKIYAQEENERRAFRAKNQTLLKANLALARTRNILFPLLEGLASVSLLLLLWLGTSIISPTTPVAPGKISVGDFVAMLLYVERLTFPTALLGFTITVYQRGEVSIDRIESIFTVQPKIQDSPTAIALPLEQVRGELRAHHLTFTYPGGVRPILNDLTFTIQPGESVAVVGPIGSGKSTLANAFPRLLEIAPGQLFLDDYDITQLRLSDLRRAIAYVPQESFLFSTTIKNNICYGMPHAEQLEIEYAAKQAQIHTEILNFPKQYETLVGERGITLSGGQRQRIALARALLGNAPILILDDALSSVDNQTATEILWNLSTGTNAPGGTLCDRKTVIFISHQLSAAAMADRIFVMDEGRIVQVGTHAELYERPGLYRSLWDRQKLEALLT